MQQADSTATAIGEGNEDALRVTQTIFKHAARISRESDISSLLLLNADLARDLTGADRCSLWLADESTNEVWTKVAHGMEQIRIPAGAGLVGACIESGESILVNDPETDFRFLRRIDQDSGYVTKSVLTVPLRADGKAIGALQVLNKPGGFNSRDVEALHLMALYSASEIQTEQLRQEAEAARLIRRELELAREVQQNLLPHDAAETAGLKYQGFFRPAKSVGGDYFDFLTLDEGRFCFTVGDVSGKGMPAAVLMASIQTLLRSHLMRQSAPLERLMTEVSDAVYLCSSPERYSTVFCGVVDGERRTLNYVNAGHVSPMLIRAKSGEVERTDVSGLPIGILPATNYRAASRPLDAGDTVVCISDGITEVLNCEGEMWDEAEIEAVLKKRQAEPLEELVAALVKRADEYAAGCDQYDDMTITAIRVSA